VATTQDPIEQILGKLGDMGVPVAEIGQKAAGLIAQAGTLNPGEMIEQVGFGEIFGELKEKVEGLDPAFKIPVLAAGGFVAARVVRWIIR
jgi:hypothetical protein